MLNIMVMVFGCIAMGFDLKARRIPNKLILAMIAGWAAIISAKLLLDPDASIDQLLDSSLGFVAGGGLFLLVYLLSKKGVGGGDVKFMAASGLYLGLFGIISAILYGTILAAIVGLCLILLKKIGRKDPIPLAPFLLAGILITILLQRV
ncbi:MAG: A24 family peptidase [Oscillospiraceae bacterium]|nr:A24 family peptidase [Oscillospiraceae bacterium]